MDFFYADCIDISSNLSHGEPVWEYACTFKNNSSEITYQQKSWKEIIEREYCVLFVTSLGNNGKSQDLEEHFSKRGIIRKNYLVIDAHEYFKNWLAENSVAPVIENELKRALDEIKLGEEALLEERFQKAERISKAIYLLYKNDERYRKKLVSVFSYHTFVFPFYITNPDSDIAIWKDELAKSVCWGRNAWKDTMTSVDMQPRDVLEKYSLYQYLTDVGRKAIFDYEEDNEKEESNIVSSWKIRDSFVRNMATYEISKGDKKYKLILNSIRLNIYNTRIALLIIEAQNCYYPAISDIKLINEYGRRIFEPFLMPNGGKCSVCADQQKIYIPKLMNGRATEQSNKSIVSNIKTKGPIQVRFEKGTVVFENKEKTQIRSVPVRGMADFIKEILDLGLCTTEIVYGQGNVLGKKYQIEIKPAIDDRMFVECLVLNGNLVSKVNQYQSGEYAYLEDPKVSNELYALFCIDTTDATCQSRTMRKVLLDEFIDSRWIEYGTIHGVTHHSLMCLTSETAPDATVISPFLNIYTKMANLVLAQRASLLRFEEDLRKLSLGFENGDNTKMNTEKVSELIVFQERYAAFQAQLLIDEITVQEQGIEIYEMLQNELQIRKNKEEIAEKISNLCEIADTHQGNIFNLFAFWFGIASIVISGLGIGSDMDTINILLVLITALCVIRPFAWKRKMSMPTFIQKKINDGYVVFKKILKKS